MSPTTRKRHLPRRRILLAVGLASILGCLPQDSAIRPGPSGGKNKPEAVTALGRLKPQGGIIQVGVPPGDRLGEILVKEGDCVCPDQPLALLDSYPDRKADLELAESQVTEARTRREAVLDNADKQIAEALLHIEVVEQTGPKDIASQEQQVQLLTDKLNNATQDLRRVNGVSSVPAQDLEKQKLAVSAARHELASAQLLLEKAQEAHKLNLRAARAQLATLKATRERARLEIPLESLEHSEKVARERFQHATIRAPAAGQVLRILGHTGEATGSQPLLLLGDTGHMVAIAEVYETEVHNVHPGQTATITSRALENELGPKEKLTGTVVSLGCMVAKNNDLSLDPAELADRRVIEATIRLDSSDVASHYVNHQVEVTILTSSADQGKTP